MNLIPENIRLNLKKYEKHLSRTCLECGYVGLMGISRVDDSKKNKWGIWVMGGFFVLFGFSVSFIGAIIIGAIAGLFVSMSDQQKIRTYVVCPSCSIELV